MNLTFGFILFPDMTQLDLTGPFEVFSRMPGVTTHLIWKTLDPVRTDRGLMLIPTATFEECPALDLVCVPGGPGQVALMEDEVVLRFLRQTALTCRYITSVCKGSLVLGAAGLLKGYRATTHWASHDQLAILGAEAVDARVVFDRNRITGAGVTSESTSPSRWSRIWRAWRSRNKSSYRWNTTQPHHSLQALPQAQAPS